MRRVNELLAAIGLIIIWTAVSACSGAPPTVAHPVSEAEGCTFDQSVLGDADWVFVDPEACALVPDEALNEQIAAARVVYAGERHDQLNHHRVQGALAELVRRQVVEHGGELLIGFEMFNPTQQAALDHYSRGTGTTLAQMIRETRWSEIWGMDHRLYAPVLEVGARDKARLLALNTERKWSKRVYEVGLSGLSPEERSQLPATVDDTNEAYRTWVLAVLRDHFKELPADDDPEWIAKQQRFFEAQLIWDESMAQNLAAALQNAGEAGRAVVVVGAGHVRNRWGLPDRVVRELGPTTDLVIVCETLSGTVQLDPTQADLFCLTRAVDVPDS